MIVDAGHKQLGHFVLNATWKIGEIDYLAEACSDLVRSLSVWIPEDRSEMVHKIFR